MICKNTLKRLTSILLTIVASSMILWNWGCTTTSQTPLMKENPSPTEKPYGLAINALVESINDKDVNKVVSFLDSNYSVVGLSREKSISVLKQVVEGYSSKITDWELIQQKGDQSGYLVDVRFHLSSREDPVEKSEKEYTFSITPDGKFQEIGLFSAMKKQMSEVAKDNIKIPAFMNVELTRLGNLIAVNAAVDGKEGLFIIDSGAPSLVLNRTHFDVEPVNSISGMGVNGQITGTDIIKIGEFRWQNFIISDLDVLTMDLSHLEAVLETDFLGLIGFRELSGFELILDYSANSLLMFGLDSSGKPMANVQMSEPSQTISFKMEGHIPIFDCRIGVVELTLGLDTGAESNLLSLEYLPVLQAEMLDLEMDTLSGADKEENEVSGGILNGMSIQGQTWSNMQTIFSDISHLSKNDEQVIHGLLGYEFLSKQRTSINFKTRELKIW